MCQNGGDLIFCDFCDQAVCSECLNNFDVMSLPRSTGFWCPSCWEIYKGKSQPYYVCTVSHVTVRLTHHIIHRHLGRRMENLFSRPQPYSLVVMWVPSTRVARLSILLWSYFGTPHCLWMGVCWSTFRCIWRVGSFLHQTFVSSIFHSISTPLTSMKSSFMPNKSRGKYMVSSGMSHIDFPESLPF